MSIISHRVCRRLCAALIRPSNNFKIQLNLPRNFYKSAPIGSYFDSKELWTIPNMITISRIIASPGLSYAIASDMKGAALCGCMIFGISDWLDGYIARTYNQKTVLGAFLDPVADKIFISALVFGLTMKGLFPLPLAMVIVARDVLLVAGSFILRASERPPGAPFFDTTNSATFEIVASDLSKINTGCQILLLTASVGNFALDFPAEILIEPLWYFTAVTTVGSGIGYLDGSGIKRVSKTGEYRSSLPKEEKLI